MPDYILLQIIVFPIDQALFTHKFPDFKSVMGINNHLKIRVDFTEMHKIGDIVFRYLQFPSVQRIGIKRPYP